MPSMKQRESYSPKYSKKPLSTTQSPVLSAEETIQDIVQWSLSQAHDDRSAVQQRALPVFHLQHPLLSCSVKKTFQLPQKKNVGGDLLHTHSRWFTETKQPFIPKVLKTASKSFLSKYRYYNPPHRMKNSLDKQTYRGPRKFYRSLEDECLRSYTDYLIQHPLKKHSKNSVSLQSLIQAKEEELKYLQFLQEVTDDILTSSCYQKEALGDVFQMHIRNRRCDLDEAKMQRMFQALKDDLNICANLPDSSIRYTGLEHGSHSLIAPQVQPTAASKSNKCNTVYNRHRRKLTMQEGAQQSTPIS